MTKLRATDSARLLPVVAGCSVGLTCLLHFSSPRDLLLLYAAPIGAGSCALALVCGADCGAASAGVWFGAAGSALAHVLTMAFLVRFDPSGGAFWGAVLAATLGGCVNGAYVGTGLLSKTRSKALSLCGVAAAAASVPLWLLLCASKLGSLGLLVGLPALCGAAVMIGRLCARTP